MKSTLFFATRIFGLKKHNSANYLFMLTLLGVSLSICIVLITFSIILGFKQQVQQLAYSQTGHISLYSYGSAWTNTHSFISYPKDVRSFLEQQKEISNIKPIIQQTALLKTQTDFAPLVLYGVEEDFPITPSNKGHTLKTKGYKSFGDYQQEKGKYPIVLPKPIANKLNIAQGDKVLLYMLVEGQIRIRSFYLADTYEAPGVEALPAICPVVVLRQVLKLKPYEFSRLILTLQPEEPISETANILAHRLSTQDKVYIPHYALSTAPELIPELFSWLRLLDSNVLFLVIVIMLIGIFTMITGIIIMLLDKVKHIGILKSLGASNNYIRRIYLIFAFRLIFWGILGANLFSSVFLYLQQQFGIICLNPRDYFVDTVPVVLSWDLFAGVSLSVLIIILLTILIPLKLVSRFSPTVITKFE